LAFKYQGVGLGMNPGSVNYRNEYDAYWSSADRIGAARAISLKSPTSWSQPVVSARFWTSDPAKALGIGSPAPRSRRLRRGCIHSSCRDHFAIIDTATRYNGG